MPDVGVQTVASPRYRVGERVYCNCRRVQQCVVVTGIEQDQQDPSQGDWIYEAMWDRRCEVFEEHRLERLGGCIVTDRYPGGMPRPKHWQFIRDETPFDSSSDEERDKETGTSPHASKRRRTVDA